MSSFITLSDQAVSHFKGILQDLPEAVGIRLGVKKSGCSGLAHTLEAAYQIQAADHVIEVANLKVFIDPGSLEHVKGMELDWVADAWGGELRYNNPNAKSHCGCGQSFNTEK